MRLTRRARRVKAAAAAVPANEKLIAVGSLSGMAPAEITGYVLIAYSSEGMMSMSGDQCAHGRMLLLASAMRETAGEVVAAGHGDHS